MYVQIYLILYSLKTNAVLGLVVGPALTRDSGGWI
jgi:hypothetical protein